MGPYYVYVEHEEKNIGNYHPLSIARDIYNQKVDGIQKIERKGKNRVCIVFKSLTSANSFLESNKLNHNGYITYIPSHLVSCKGVVKYINPSISEDDLMKYTTANVQILSVRRINRRVKVNNEIQWIPSSTVLYTFGGTMLPRYISIFLMNLKVETYILPGHNAKQCRGRKRCSNCSSYHEESLSNCIPKCLHCSSSEHNSFNRSCKEYERQKELRKTMSLENLSYFEANQRFPSINQKTTYRPNINTFPRLTNYQKDKIDINQRRQTISESHKFIPKYSHVVNKSKDTKKRRMESRVQGYDKEIIKNNLYSHEVSSLPLKPIIPRTSNSISSNPLDVCNPSNNKLELRSDSHKNLIEYSEVDWNLMISEEMNTEDINIPSFPGI